MTRREFVRAAAFAATLAFEASAWAKPLSNSGPPAVKPFELDEWTIGELQSALGSARLTAVTLVEKYLERIEDIDRNGPGLRSVIELNPDAIDTARALDRERKESGPRSLLHGIPVLIKDNLATTDRMATTAGSLALVGAVPQREAFVVRRLREAGAVLLGKTNLSEWANFRSTHSTSGWSGRGGLTRNPYVLDRNPSGSSSGSGAAVAANLCAVAVGTETDGSIVSPSSANGIVGIKPTVGLVSRSGIIPISHTQDTAGPMARTVTDAAILLGIMAGEDPRDNATKPQPKQRRRDYTDCLDANGLHGARIGVVREYFDIHPRAVEVLESVLEEMRRSGAILIDPAELPSHGQFGGAEMEVLLYEFKAGLNAYLADLAPGAPVRTLRDVIEFNERNLDREMPYFGQELFLKAEVKGPLTEEPYRKALDKCRRLARKEGIDAVMDAHRLDALVAPAAGPAHVTDLLHGDRDIGGSSGPAAVAGYPNITIPAGLVSGLPVGISFFGRAYSEAVLLKLAFACEQAIRARQAPRFIATGL